MEESEKEQYAALMKEVGEVKKAFSLDRDDTALLLMIYDKLLEQD